LIYGHQSTLPALRFHEPKSRHGCEQPHHKARKEEMSLAKIMNPSASHRMVAAKSKTYFSPTFLTHHPFLVLYAFLVCEFLPCLFVHVLRSQTQSPALLLSHPLRLKTDELNLRKINLHLAEPPSHLAQHRGASPPQMPFEL